MVTAAHCVFDSKKDNTDEFELLPSSALSVMLGLHNKIRLKEEMR